MDWWWKSVRRGDFLCCRNGKQWKNRRRKRSGRALPLQRKASKAAAFDQKQKIPVLVLMEGWGTAGKGSVIGQVIQNIDPRFFKVESMGEKEWGGAPKPFLYRYFKRIPEEGKFVFLDSGWMDEIVKTSCTENFPMRITQNGSRVWDVLSASLQITVIWSWNFSCISRRKNRQNGSNI